MICVLTQEHRLGCEISKCEISSRKVKVFPEEVNKGRINFPKELNFGGKKAWKPESVGIVWGAVFAWPIVQANSTE